MLIRKLSTTGVYLKNVVANNLKGKSVSSQKWLLRQLKDPYVEKANMMNYRCDVLHVKHSHLLRFLYCRCRSAFKLLEIDEKYNILRPGSVVVDCGASPGSWSQVAADKVLKPHISDCKNAMVIAIDKQHVFPIAVNIFYILRTYTTLNKSYHFRV